MLTLWFDCCMIKETGRDWLGDTLGKLEREFYSDLKSRVRAAELW